MRYKVTVHLNSYSRQVLVSEFELENKEKVQELIAEIAEKGYNGIARDKGELTYIPADTILFVKAIEVIEEIK